MGKGRLFKLVICILLVVSTLTLSLSVFAVDPSPSPTPVPSEDFGPIIAGNEYLVSYYIYQVMKSWGMEVTYNNIHGFVEETRDAILSYVLEYIDQIPSIYSINEWIAPWTADYDYWGNLRYNQYMVEDIQDFVDWLISTLGIQDNEVTQISGGLSLRGVTVYQTNKWYRVSKYDGLSESASFVKFTNNEYTNNASDDPIYFLVVDNGVSWNAQYLLFFSTYSHSVNLGIHAVNLDNTDDLVNNSYISVNMNQLHGGYYLRNSFGTSVYRYEDGVALEAPSSGALDYVKNWFDGSYIQTEDGVYVESGVINLPANDEDYTPGDSIVITDSGPIYVTIEWPDSISVDNLPAVISPTTIVDPDLEGVYGEVTPFIRTFSSGMDMMRSIIMQLPEETIACLFALMGAIIIFGFIKIMREH